MTNLSSEGDARVPERRLADPRSSVQQERGGSVVDRLDEARDLGDLGIATEIPWNDPPVPP